MPSSPEKAQEFFNTFDFAKIQTRRQAHERLKRGLLSVFKAAKINYIEGTASFINDKEIAVNGQTVTFDDVCHVLKAPLLFIPLRLISIKINFLITVIFLPCKNVPARLTIIGGGVIGCEFACIFNALGSKVTIVEMLPSIVAMEDEDSVRVLKTSFEKARNNVAYGPQCKRY